MAEGILRHGCHRRPQAGICHIPESHRTGHVVARLPSRGVVLDGRRDLQGIPIVQAVARVAAIAKHHPRHPKGMKLTFDMSYDELFVACLALVIPDKAPWD